MPPNIPGPCFNCDGSGNCAPFHNWDWLRWIVAGTLLAWLTDQPCKLCRGRQPVRRFRGAPPGPTRLDRQYSAG
jgi:hypothetical protein